MANVLLVRLSKLMAINMTHGALTSPKDVRNYRMVSASSLGDLPTAYEIQNMPEVKNQGFYSACVAYALAIIAEWHCRRYGDETADLSPFYNYGNRRYTTWTGKGLYSCDALKTARKVGFVTTKQFPYKGEMPSIQKDFEREYDELVDVGMPNRFSETYLVKTEAEIKTALMVHGPVLTSIEWYADIRVKDGVITTKAEANDRNSNHAMVIYGWNEQGWLIQNSYGTLWGNKGRAVLPYSVPLRETYGIIDEISENHRKQEIDELTFQNHTLTARVETLMVQIHDMQEEWANFDTTTEKCFELESEIITLKEELSKTLGEIDTKNAEIERLKAENIELKKPFSSPIGQVFAKLINFIINLINTKRS